MRTRNGTGKQRGRPRERAQTRASERGQQQQRQTTKRRAETGRCGRAKAVPHSATGTRATARGHAPGAGARGRGAACETGQAGTGRARATCTRAWRRRAREQQTRPARASYISSAGAHSQTASMDVDESPGQRRPPIGITPAQSSPRLPPISVNHSPASAPSNPSISSASAQSSSRSQSVRGHRSEVCAPASARHVWGPPRPRPEQRRSAPICLPTAQKASFPRVGVPNMFLKVTRQRESICHLHFPCKACYAFHFPRRGLTFAIRRFTNFTYRKAGNLYVIPIISETYRMPGARSGFFQPIAARAWSPAWLATVDRSPRRVSQSTNLRRMLKSTLESSLHPQSQHSSDSRCAFLSRSVSATSDGDGDNHPSST